MIVKHEIFRTFVISHIYFLAPALTCEVVSKELEREKSFQVTHGCLGNLASGLVSLDNGLDDTDSNGLSHVTDGEASKRRVVSEGLNTHWLGRNHLDDSSVTRLDELGSILNGLAGTTINLLQELSELAGDVGGVTVEDWCIACTDLAGVVEDDDLSIERFGSFGGIVLGVTSNVTTTDFLDRHVLDVEADIVTWQTLDKLFVVHLDRLDFGGDVSRSEGHDHTRLDDTGLDTSDGHRSNTTDLVDILEGKTEGLVGGTGWGINSINSLEKGLAASLRLGFLLPALIPRAVRRVVNHVVTVEARDRDERNSLGVVSDLLDEVGSLLDDFVETSLRPLGGVHLVDGDDELLDAQGVGKQGVLTSLTILGDTGFEFTSTGSDDEDSAVGLGGTRDHVLDEVTMARSVCTKCQYTNAIGRGRLVAPMTVT